MDATVSMIFVNKSGGSVT